MSRDHIAPLPARNDVSLRKIFLHIGMSKAGSSAIQQALIDNIEVLTESGISFPQAGRRGLAHYKILEEIRKDRSYNRLQRALDEAASSDAIVLSCEAFWLMDDSEIKLLQEALLEYETWVLIYLRRPADYLPSSYRQGIKQEGKSYTWATYLDGARDRVDYPQLLERWARHFPLLRVRTYEAVREALEKDFLQAIGAPMKRVDMRRRIVNPTPSDGALYLMLLANRYLPPRVNKQARRLIQGLRRRFDFMPSLEDEALCQYGKEIVRKWNMNVLETYLSQKDLDLLIGENF